MSLFGKVVPLLQKKQRGASGHPKHDDITRKINSYLHGVFGIQQLFGQKELENKLVSDIRGLLQQKRIETGEEIASVIGSDRRLKAKVHALFLDFLDQVFQHTRRIGSMKEFIAVLMEILSGGKKLDVSSVYQKYKDLTAFSQDIYRRQAADQSACIRTRAS